MNTLYKDKNGNIYSVSPIQQPKEVWVKLTKKEIEAHLNPKPTSDQVLASQMEEAQTYLDRTDHKFYIGYVPKTDEDCAVIQALRDEKREFIRANE